MQVDRFVLTPLPKQVVKVYNKTDKYSNAPDTFYYGAVIESRFVPTTHIIGGAMTQKVLLREIKWIKFDLEDIDFFLLKHRVIKIK